MGMGEIKENEATVNEITQENVEEQPVVYKEYSTEYLVSAVEAILFSIGESVSVDRLAKALEMETKKLSKQMEEVLEIYNQSDRGIKMVELENAYQLCTRNEYYDVLTKVATVAAEVASDKLYVLDDETGSAEKINTEKVKTQSTESWADQVTESFAEYYQSKEVNDHLSAVVETAAVKTVR